MSFERYDEFDQDEKGIYQWRPRSDGIAWFKDPAGNILAVLGFRRLRPVNANWAPSLPANHLKLDQVC